MSWGFNAHLLPVEPLILGSNTFLPILVPAYSLLPFPNPHDLTFFLLSSQEELSRSQGKSGVPALTEESETLTFFRGPGKGPLIR